MKMDLKFTILAMTFVSLVLFSCEDDSNRILGTWDYTLLEASGCTDSNDNFSWIYGVDGYCEDMLGINTCTTKTITFDENGTFSILSEISEGGIFMETNSNNGIYFIENGTITICDGSDCIIDASLDYEGNNLTLTWLEFGCSMIMGLEK